MTPRSAIAAARLVWFSEEALAGWRAQPRKTPGGQAHYSGLAIETALTLRAVFKLALRQSEGLIGSIMRLLAIGLPVPDHSTLSYSAPGIVGCTYSTSAEDAFVVGVQFHCHVVVGGRQ